MRFAEVVVLLLDATIPFEKQDLTLADLVEREGRALVIGLNKWDLDRPQERQGAAAARRGRPAAAATEGDARHPGLGAHRRPHIDKLLEAVVATHEVWNRRISTGRLNRWLAPVDRRDAAARPAGRRVKIRYMTQPKARPPFFVLFGNHVDSIPESYKRYLVNGLRETFGLFGVPIRLSMRSGGENPTRPSAGADSGARGLPAAARVWRSPRREGNPRDVRRSSDHSQAGEGRVVVRWRGRTIADSGRALELREHTYPPVLYIPRADANMSLLQRSSLETVCPYKGRANYFSLRAGEEVDADAVWTYETPRRASRRSTAIWPSIPTRSKSPARRFEPSA